MSAFLHEFLHISTHIPPSITSLFAYESGSVRACRPPRSLLTQHSQGHRILQDWVRDVGVGSTTGQPLPVVRSRGDQDDRASRYVPAVHHLRRERERSGVFINLYYLGNLFFFSLSLCETCLLLCFFLCRLCFFFFLFWSTERFSELGWWRILTLLKRPWSNY